MNISLLATAPWYVQWHVGAAVIAFGLGLVQIVSTKGTPAHRLMGYVFVVLMLGLAASSLFIHEWRLFDAWSPIHILALLVLWAIPIAVYQARQGRIALHGRIMRIVFFGMVCGALLLTLLPGRLMHAVMFGA